MSKRIKTDAPDEGSDKLSLINKRNAESSCSFNGGDFLPDPLRIENASKRTAVS